MAQGRHLPHQPSTEGRDVYAHALLDEHQHEQAEVAHRQIAHQGRFLPVPHEVLRPTEIHLDQHDLLVEATYLTVCVQEALCPGAPPRSLNQ